MSSSQNRFLHLLARIHDLSANTFLVSFTILQRGEEELGTQIRHVPGRTFMVPHFPPEAVLVGKQWPTRFLVTFVDINGLQYFI